jgi:hypothetical protein
MKTEERNEPIKPLPLQRHLMAKTDWKRRKHSCRIFDVDGDTVVPTDYRYVEVMVDCLKDCIAVSSLKCELRLICNYIV